MWTWITRTLALIRKEMLALLKDPSSRTLLFAPALMQALLFGYGATYDLTNAPFAVLDQSRSAESREILARLEGTGVFRRIATLDSSSQIADQIDSGAALLVMLVSWLALGWTFDDSFYRAMVLVVVAQKLWDPSKLERTTRRRRWSGIKMVQ